MLSDIGTVKVFSGGQGPHRGGCSWEVKGAGPPISHYGLRGATQHIKSLSRVGFVPLSYIMKGRIGQRAEGGQRAGYGT